MNTNEQETSSSDEERGGGLLKAVKSVIIKPEDAKALVEAQRKRFNERYSKDDESKIQERIARAIVARYAKLAAIVGGGSALTGIVPGLGTVIAVTGGATADAIICMKLQVDMCYCLAEAFGYDITREDSRHLAFLIACGGTLEKAGVGAGVKIATKAGVKMLRQYLKGAALQAVREFFKRIGFRFARKAAEKALPFGIGVVISSSANYGLTRYVGRQAKKWFIIDRDTE